MNERFLERLLIALTLPRDRPWIEAILAEADLLPSPERRAWQLAAARLALCSWLGSTLPAALAMATALIAVDWLSGALLPAIALMFLAAVILRRGPENGRSVSLAVSAGTLPAAHAFANWVPQLRPHYQYARLDLRDWAILATIGLIGVCLVRIVEIARPTCRFTPSGS
jgi:hypothetical protein